MLLLLERGCAGGAAANGGRTQYVWPATGSNAKFVNGKATAYYTGKNKYLAPGALLAIPASRAATVNTTTPIGRKIRQAMIDYGAYIVDGAGHSSHARCARRTTSGGGL